MQQHQSFVPNSNVLLNYDLPTGLHFNRDIFTQEGSDAN